MTREEWEAEIAAALDGEPTSVPDREGETPVLRVAGRLRRLPEVGIEAVVSCRALVNIVKGMEAGDIRRWIDLCRILRSAERPDPEIRDALYERFVDGQPSDVEARTHVMTTLGDLGYPFTPTELEREIGIRDTYPGTWVYAWIRSGYFERIKDTIPRLIRPGGLTATDLLGLLPTLHQQLGSSLVGVTTRWTSKLPSNERNKIEAWLMRRGLTVPRTTRRTHDPANSATRTHLTPGDAEFLQERWTANRIGEAHSLQP